MAGKQLADRYTSQHARIKCNIDDSQNSFTENVKRYQKCKRFLFESTLLPEDEAVLNDLGRPVLQFNVLEAYVSRLCGEFSKQEPSIAVRALNDQSDPDTISTVEGIIRAILFDANNDQFEMDVYRDQLSGGFSVMKVWTDYEHGRSFNQNIKIGRAFDPTMCGFDPLARAPHKGDGRYCYELIPKTKEEFKREYPKIDLSRLSFVRNTDGFNWTYQEKSKDILYICDYYEKKTVSSKIYLLSDQNTYTQDQYEQLEQEVQRRAEMGDISAVMPEIIKERKTEENKIVRYRIIGNQVIDYDELSDFTSLPLIFVDGNSALIKNKQITRPYIYNAMDAQRLKNFSGISLGNELENMEQHTWLVDVKSIPEKDEGWINPQKSGLLTYNSRDDIGNELPSPNPVPRQPIPAEIAATFNGADSSIQNILGSYDASLGINNNQLSGVAIVEGATQSNSAAMPYVMNFLAAFNQAAQIMVELIPKYYVTPRTVPIVDQQGKRSYQQINGQSNVSMNYPSNALEVRVEAGVNFEVQKNRALQTITQLMSASEGFAQMIEQGGLPVLVDNLDIRGADQLKKMAEEFTENIQQQQQQGANQPNPQMMAIQLQQQKQQMEAQYKDAQIQLQQQKLENERLKLQLEQEDVAQDNAVQMTKAHTEQMTKAMDMSMQYADMKHNHNMDHLKIHTPYNI